MLVMAVVVLPRQRNLCLNGVRIRLVTENVHDVGRHVRNRGGNHHPALARVAWAHDNGEGLVDTVGHAGDDVKDPGERSCPGQVDGAVCDGDGGEGAALAV